MPSNRLERLVFTTLLKMIFLQADLGVTKTHNCPHLSNDNPFSEAQFKTLKYRPTCPTRFGSLEEARAFCRSFFHWYNTEHRHSGIAFMTPESVHYRRAPEIRQVRSNNTGSCL